MVWFYGLDSRPVCLPVEQLSDPNYPLVRGNPHISEHQDPEALHGIQSRGTSPFAGGVQVQQLGAMQEPIPDLKIVHK